MRYLTPEEHADIQQLREMMEKDGYHGPYLLGYKGKWYDEQGNEVESPFHDTRLRGTGYVGHVERRVIDHERL